MNITKRRYKVYVAGPRSVFHEIMKVERELMEAGFTVMRDLTSPTEYWGHRPEYVAGKEMEPLEHISEADALLVFVPPEALPFGMGGALEMAVMTGLGKPVVAIGPVWSPVLKMFPLAPLAGRVDSQPGVLWFSSTIGRFRLTLPEIEALLPEVMAPAGARSVHLSGKRRSGKTTLGMKWLRECEHGLLVTPFAFRRALSDRFKVVDPASAMDVDSIMGLRFERVLFDDLHAIVSRPGVRLPIDWVRFGGELRMATSTFSAQQARMLLGPKWECLEIKEAPEAVRDSQPSNRPANSIDQG